MLFTFTTTRLRGFVYAERGRKASVIERAGPPRLVHQAVSFNSRVRPQGFSCNSEADTASSNSEAHMPIVAKLDELGKPAWIALMILGFMVWWPVGLATLAFIIGSGRMSCWKGGGVSRWQDGVNRMHQSGTWWQPSRTSGNRAFDDYREETLRRLEEEQREFHEFLGRLRMAKDKAEFDQFMAERRSRANPSPPPQS
jgi:hypothetical protein